jgi:hypothetical protein
MKKSVITFTIAACLCAIAARADTIVISFSGSGTSGTIAPGEPWLINGLSTNSWSSPGLGLGTTQWPGAPTQQDITDFTITFTGLPTGVTIDPGSLATPADVCSGVFTVFCSGPTFLVGNQWVSTLSNGNDTITSAAPAGISLNGGDFYFVNVLFTGPVSSVTFTGGWSTPTPVPEPATLGLLSIGLLAISYVGRRCTAR